MDPNRLTAIPIFSDLSDEEARRLATYATETSVAEGQILMKQGDYSVELIAIEEGTADVIRDGEKIASVGKGDLIGEMGLAGAPAAQRRRDRHLSHAGHEAHSLGDPPDVAGHRRSDSEDDRGPALGRRGRSRRGLEPPSPQLFCSFFALIPCKAGPGEGLVPS